MESGRNAFDWMIWRESPLWEHYLVGRSHVYLSVNNGQWAKGTCTPKPGEVQSLWVRSGAGLARGLPGSFFGDSPFRASLATTTLITTGEKPAVSKLLQKRLACCCFVSVRTFSSHLRIPAYGVIVTATTEYAGMLTFTEGDAASAKDEIVLWVLSRRNLVACPTVNPGLLTVTCTLP